MAAHLALRAAPLDTGSLAPAHGPGLSAATLVEGLLASATNHPAAATVFPGHGEAISAADLVDASARCAAAFMEAGLSSGALVGILMPSDVTCLVGLFGALRTGAAASVLPVPAGLRTTSSDIARLRRIIDAAGIRHVVANPRFDALAGELRSAANVALLQLDAAHPTRALPEIDPDAPAVVQFTSGTTGWPRGVTLSHRAVMAGIRAIRTSAGLTPADVLVQWAPLYHDMGLFGLLSQMVDGAVSHVFEPMAFLRSPRSFLRHLAACGGTVTTGPNFSYDMLCDAATGDAAVDLDLSRWRVAFNGAEPVRPATVRRFGEVFAPAGVGSSTMYPVYGMAEATLAVTFPRPGVPPVTVDVDQAMLADSGVVRIVSPEHERSKAYVSVGVPVTGVAVRLVNRAGRTVGAGTVGEIQISGGPLMSGYYNDPRATAQSFDGDWFRTGDLGFWVDGRLFIAGRSKEMVVVHGRNYFPEDAEEVARTVDGVYRERCVAFADIAEDGAERIAVAVESVVPPDGRSALADEIRERITVALGVSAVRVYVVEPRWLPRTTSGKWERLSVRQRLAQRGQRAGGA